jgi:hypothetical protein
MDCLSIQSGHPDKSMKPLLAFLLVAHSAAGLAATTYQCREKTEVSTNTASIRIVNGEPMAFAFHTQMGDRNRFSCDVMSQRSSKEEQWLKQGDKTIVKFEEGEVHLEKLPDAYKIKFVDMRDFLYCGMQAGLPWEVTIYKQHKRCRSK